jgi:predicted Zn-dependent peptidase
MITSSNPHPTKSASGLARLLRTLFLTGAFAAYLGGCAGSKAQGPDPVASASSIEPTPPEPAPPAAPAEPPPPALTFPDEPFRAQQPAPGEVKSLKTPELGRFSLPGGISVYLIERHNLPIVSLSLVFEGGSRIDPRNKDGLAALCADLLSEGTEKLDKLAFEEIQADLASSVSSGASEEQHFVSMNSLKKNFGPTLDLWADTLLHPGMRQAELDRNLKRQIAGLAQLKGSAAAVAGRLTNSIVYGTEHIFGRFPTEASYGALKLDDCKKFQADYIKPQGAKLFVVGDVTKDELTKEIGARLKGWKGSPKPVPSLGRAKARDGKIFFVDIPGAPQSVVQMMHLGPPRKAPDFHATSVMSAILGGGFTSRLNMNIREKHGYAYGAGSGFAYHRAGSTFRASASVRTDVTKESILEMIKEVRGLRDGDPTEAEVAREKDGKILALPAQFSTGNSTLSAFRDLIYYGLPLNYFDTYVPKVKAVDVAAVKKAATRYLKPGEVRLLVVGDGKTVLPKLKELADNKDLAGKIVILDPDGNLAPGEAAASNSAN